MNRKYGLKNLQGLEKYGILKFKCLGSLKVLISKLKHSQDMPTLNKSIDLFTCREK